MTADLERTSGRTVELDIGGMTCASCAARIEKKLNRMPGVEATVNYATEKARLTLPDDLGADDAIATVVATGYTATVPSPRQTAVQADADVSLLSPEAWIPLRRPSGASGCWCARS